MSTTDSPAISRRQRVEDSKPLLSGVDVLPVVHSPAYIEKAEPPISYDSTPSRGTPSSSGGLGGYVTSRLQMYRSQYPILKKAHEMVLRVPPRVRCIFIVFWFAWKIILLLAFLTIMAKNSKSNNGPSVASSPRAPHNITWHNANNNNIHTTTNATRVLYIVTSSSEYDDGYRNTIKGRDRFLHQTLPVMIDNVQSMTRNSNLDVDLFLVCAYKLTPEREEMIRSRLPGGVGFQYWDNATPLTYKEQDISGSKIIEYKRSLARQHRFVIRDKFDYYDMFVAFEDDMSVRGHHLHHYLQLSTEVERLLALGPAQVPEKDDDVDNYKNTKFFGHMTSQQLERIVPGFFRVEVVMNKNNGGTAEHDVSPIPIDHEFEGVNEGSHREVNIDPTLCCDVHLVPNEGTNGDVPVKPVPEGIIAWETNITAFSLRQFPPTSELLNWVALMLGPGKGLRQDKKIGGFWTGRKGAFQGEKKPNGATPGLVGQQGGWMATKSQLIRMNNKLCKANFLPPFNKMGSDDDTFNDFGTHNVEFWSGSYQFFTGGGKHCNMQRIISMDPDHFSKHLLYHTSNNKQHQRSAKRIIWVNEMFGQLNHIRKTAEQEKIALQTS